MATTRSRAKEGKITEAFLRGLKRPGIYRDGVIPGFLVRAGKRARTFELRIERPPKMLWGGGEGAVGNHRR